ncbi:putative endonuclease [Paenibacillus sp. DS2015]|uniref:YraN family protein n=1 Tax=Paenibacillus sp. DS2015 TaxID=3373917 RepID=UPI003D252D40
MDEQDHTNTRKQKGAAAEEAAARHLIVEGYHILDRNWRCRSGELDIVACKNNVIVIVEVRSRTGDNTQFGTPAESVNARKINQVRKTAEVYLYYKQVETQDIRFDVMAVNLNKDMTVLKLEHILHAF